MSIAKLVPAAAVGFVIAGMAGAASERRALAVLELRTSLASSARGSVDVAALEERVRALAERALPDVRVLERGQPALPEGCSGDCEAAAARDAGADWLISGELLRVEPGLLVALELREARSGRLVAMQTAVAGTPQELPEAVSGAARDLLKPLKPSLARGLDDLPALPAPPGPLQAGGALNLPADSRALVACDRARAADARGQENPDEAAAAWEALAEVGGKNPYAESAAARAAQWRSYAATRQAFDAQLASDTEQARAVLPLASMSGPARLELLGRYARAYGEGRATPLVALLPEELRARASLTIRCEAHDAQSCLSLAKLADDEKDAKAASGLFELACEAGAAKACAEAGERLLAVPRDPVRAISAFQRGCASRDARSCARLARIYEEGDGTDANLLAAHRLRDDACAAGDGRSCRKLACAVEEDAPALDAARALSFSQRGCSDGDAISCALAKALSRGQSRRVIQPGSPEAAQPASKTPRPPLPFAFPPRPPSGASDDSRAVGGVVLLSVALVATAAWLADSEFGRPRFSWRRWGRERPSALTLNSAPAAAAGGKALQLALGAGALAAAGAGLTLLLTRPSSSAPEAFVTASPNGLAVSGTLP